MPRVTTKQDLQKRINEEHGEGKWTVLEYSGSHKPIVLKHECGAEKRLTRASTFTSGKMNKCEKCEVSKMGRPKLNKPIPNFEELNKRISDATYGTYELIEVIDADYIVINHKNCERKPFRTTIKRFFEKGNRCQCVKKGVVGRNPKGYMEYEE